MSSMVMLGTELKISGWRLAKCTSSCFVSAQWPWPGGHSDPGELREERDRRLTAQRRECAFADIVATQKSHEPRSMSDSANRPGAPVSFVRGDDAHAGVLSSDGCVSGLTSQASLFFAVSRNRKPFRDSSLSVGRMLAALDRPHRLAPPRGRRSISGSSHRKTDGPGGLGRRDCVLLSRVSPALVLIAVTTLAACVLARGRLTNSLSSTRTGRNGRASSSPATAASPGARFWIPAHAAFELLLVVTLVVTWGEKSLPHCAFGGTWSATP